MANESKVCPRCHKRFRGYSRQRFCSSTCCDRYHANLAYIRLRSGATYPKSFDKECIECGANYTTTHRAGKYCSIKCHTNANARRYYWTNKRARTPSFRKRAERNKQRIKEYRKVARESGICTRCLTNKTHDGERTCDECKLYLRTGYR